MVLYKSFCRSPKTFHGITFRYGETKAVHGYIHDPRFVCLGAAKPVLKAAAPKVDAVNSKVIAQKLELNKAEKKTEAKIEKKVESKKDESKPAAKPSEKKEEAKATEQKKAEIKKDESKKSRTAEKDK